MINNMCCNIKNIQAKEVTISAEEYKEISNKDENDIIYEFNKQCNDIHNSLVDDYDFEIEDCKYDYE
jgi:phosphoribosylaminoimidazole-succinocarboxamide synthase